MSEQPDEIIRSLIETNRKKFHAYASNPAHRHSLAIEGSRLQYFITNSVFSFAKDSSRVRAVHLETLDSNYLRFVVVESRDSYLRPEEGEAKVDDPYKVMLVNSNWELGNFLNPDDLIYLNVVLENITASPDVLRVIGYTDNPDFRGKGMARSFYGRLEEIARALGYRFFVGENSPENVRIFKKIGRVLLSGIKPENRRIFDPHAPIDLVTVDFLYDEDRGKYLITEESLMT